MTDMLGTIRGVAIGRKRLRADRRAVTALEFAMILALIGMVLVTAMTGMGRGVAATLSQAGGGL